MQIVNAEQAPKPIGPFSHATVSPDGLIFVSGQVGVNPETGDLPEGIEAQTVQVLKNMDAILLAAGSNKSKVLKCNIYILDMANFATVNKIYEHYFEGHKPARACVAVVALPRGAIVEIECVAIKA